MRHAGGRPGRLRARHLPEAAEINPLEGCKPVIWWLLSNREAGSLKTAVELIDWYHARWEIELFFLIPKEGCHVEQLQLSTLEYLESARVLYLVIAWRINRLMRLGRADATRTRCRSAVYQG